MDRPQPVTLASPLSESPPPAGAAELGGSEAAELREQVKRGHLVGLRQYLARSREECDWQDRLFMLSLVVPSIRLAALDSACESEPEAADVFLLRCAFFSELATTMRGTGTSDKAGSDRFRNALERIKAALLDLDKTAQLDPQDPTAHAFVLPSLTIFGHLLERQQRAFQQATELAPDLVPAYRAIVTSLSERWQGSHEKSLKFARFAMTKAGPVSDMPSCLFWAHLLVRSHFAVFDKNPEAAEDYVRNSEVTRQLDMAFDSWTEPPYLPRRSSIPFLHHAACWYYLAGDSGRLQRALALTNHTFSKIPWSLIGNSHRVYARALSFAAGSTLPPQPRRGDPCEQCLRAVSHASHSAQQGKLAVAEKSLRMALHLARTAPQEQGSHLLPLALFHMSLLRHRARKEEEAQQLREQAMGLLEANSNPMESAKFQYLMAKVLYRLGEYRRALPFWEQAIGLAGEETDSTMMAEMLHTMGDCYCRIGLRDHATVPLRTALKIYRASPENPRLAAVQIGRAHV